MDIEGIFETLNDAGVRYVCVGGVAVVLRGVDRITADATIRQFWIDEKGMRVMSFYDPSGARPDVDLFVENPIEFSELDAGAETVSLRRTHCRVAGVEHLVKMKQAAGRAKDLSDIRELRERQRSQQSDAT